MVVLRRPHDSLRTVVYTYMAPVYQYGVIMTSCQHMWVLAWVCYRWSEWIRIGSGRSSSFAYVRPSACGMDAQGAEDSRCFCGSSKGSQVKRDSRNLSLMRDWNIRWR